MKTKLNFRKMLMVFAIVASTQAIGQTTNAPAINTYDYKNALGVRFGGTSGLTYKHIFERNNAFEGILSAWPNTLGVTALYEKYFSFGVDGLNWYVGGGGHGVFWSTYRATPVYVRNDRYVYFSRDGGAAVGVDGILGIEYKFRPIPLAVSADLKPFFETNTYGYSYIALDPSIGLKFTF